MQAIMGAASLALIVLGCTGVPEPKVSAKGRQIPGTDWRAAMVGEWRLYFYADTVRGGGPAVEPVLGTLRIYDTLPGGPDKGEVLSDLQVDFGPALGRPISCAPPPHASIGLLGSADSLTLLFTPHAADCGFAASAVLRGDSLIGAWSESSFAGPAVRGRFRMIRPR